ncbi:MAG: NUDIX hydrolase [Actinomycetota bacterium]
MARVRHERSAGGVLLVPIGDHILVPLITVPGSEVVGLPKGRIERGETAVEAAVREMREEAGLTGMTLEALGTISYRFWAHAEKSRVNKSVDFFLMLYRAGSPARYRPDEVDHVRLAPLSEAEALLTHDGEKAIIRAARRRVRDLSADGFLAVRDPLTRNRLIAAGA